MERRHRQPSETAASPTRIVGASDRPLDQTPPPDHDGFVEASARGLEAIRERGEKRRRKP
jgi:hypothetical protein